MVLYNYEKKFVGIAQKDLQALNLASLAELYTEAAEFADLFVKTPGYIHNFKHVHWIDFIKSADSLDENRVIISVKGKNYKATLDLQEFFFTDNPDKPGYGIVLNGLRELTKEESNRISGDLAGRVAPEPYTPPATPTSFQEEPTFEEPQAVAPMEVEEFLEEKMPPLSVEEEEKEVGLELDESVFETVSQPEEPKEEYEEQPLEVASHQHQEVYVPKSEEDEKFRDYHFDPEVAAKELGLPVDLVEEFIQDFIAQAEEFKTDLYQALDEGRIDSLRMLSHKLKGVAANLRIEDAYDALITINTSDDIDLVKNTLDRFYAVILKKLSGEEVVYAPEEKTMQAEETEPLEEIRSEATQEESLSLEQEPEISLVEESSQLEEADEANENEPEEVEAIEIDLASLMEEDNSHEEPSQETEETPKSQEESFDIEEISLQTQEPDEENAFVSGGSIEEVEGKALSSKTEQMTKEQSYILDKAHIAAELGIDLNTYNELLHDYIEDIKSALPQLQKAIEEKETEVVQKIALRLKGMSDNMHITVMAEKFEKLFQEGLERAEELVEKIEDEINSIERMV